ncbi:helix-turn-helix domain-containing protein [Enterococcus sp. BWB1-3]|uniref:helix-turn-helix domain-containing protein n=1 Tax=Enterococcus sp. BWB1-3 TaxID=2787713 RepID=UPI001921A011|nr:helix-turn-helix domain-containing protein [Enterococcus sp. BWB1-3]MBL1229966.1 helix-turn-helix domain-containing protein [Enterococcus sp. BWB1-3]
MEPKDLRTIYPDAERHNYPAIDPAYLSIPTDSGYLWLLKKKLSEKEQLLLTLLSKEVPSSGKSTNSLWYQILFRQKRIEKEGHFRVIQIQLQLPDDFLIDAWKEHINGIFSHAEDSLFLTPQSALLIEKQAEYTLTKEELEGIFLTLDDDFGTLSSVFIGGFHGSTSAFPALFEEEQTIFREESHLMNRQRVFDISDVALHYFTKDALAKSSLILSMKEEWVIDEEMKEIIYILWRNQGNISSTAKELFMHRNTLQYRLEKFQENTSLQLKNTDDLILCFLLLNS